MKKITSLLLVLVLLLSCTLLFSACDSNNDNSGTNTDNCQHSYDFITTEATCSEGGNATFKCSLCGDTISEYEDAYGHLPSNDGYCVDCSINTVQYISNRSIQHDNGYYTFIFSLLDENEFEIAVNATVKMRIENENNEVVYQATKKVTTDDYSTWSNNYGKEWYAASLKIYDSDIEAGASENGNFIFEVTVNDDCYFEEYSLSVYDLPKIDLADQCKLTLPSLPHSFSDKTNNDWLISKITAIDYYFEENYSNQVNLHLSFSGERTDFDFQENLSKYCEIAYKIVDEEGYVVSSGSIYTPALEPGEKFKNVTETIYGLEPGKYTLILLGVVD